MKEKIEKQINNLLPVYIRLWPTYFWLCAWAAPLLPASLLNYWKALRITIRRGLYHERIVFAIKKGLV